MRNAATAPIVSASTGVEHARTTAVSRAGYPNSDVIPMSSGGRSRWLTLTSVVLCLSGAAGGQNSDAGEKIYSENAKSVVTLYAQSASGETVAQGSGFLDRE